MTDAQVIEFADRERRVVITKDADFVNSHLLHARPATLLPVSKGNSKRELEQLVVPLIPVLVREFQVPRAGAGRDHRTRVGGYARSKSTPEWGCGTLLFEKGK